MSRISRHLDIVPLLAALTIPASLLLIHTIPAGVLGGALLIVTVISSYIVRALSSYSRDAASIQATEGVRSLTEVWPPPTASELLGGPLMGDYLPRDIDQTLAEKLKNDGFVLVVGAPGSGKTISLLKAADTVYPTHRILAPSSEPGGLARLIEAGPPAASGPLPMLLLLDGFEEFVDSPQDVGALSGALSAGRELPRWFTVIAAMRTSSFEECRSDPRLAELLRLAEVVEIAPSLSDPEWAQVEEFLVGKPAWLADAAADWARTGIGVPIRDDDLRELVTVYGQGESAASEKLSAQLERIVRDGLLHTREEGSARSYEADPSLIAAREKAGASIPHAAWRQALARATPEQALAIAHAAGATGEQAIEEEALLNAIRSTDPSVSTESAVQLGNLATRAGDYERATELLRSALDSKQQPLREQASYQYAAATAQLGRLEEATSVLTELVDAAASPVREAATIRLAELHEERGDVDAAEELLRESLTLTADPTASFLLGHLLLRRGSEEGARQALEVAARQGHVRAMTALGALEESNDRTEDATYWYREAAEMGSGSAALQLGALLAETSPSDAEAWFLRAMERPDSDSAAAAALNLGRLTLARGDLDAANSAFQRALDYSSSPPGELVGQISSPSDQDPAEERILKALESGQALDETQISSAALLAPNTVADALRRLTAKGMVEALPGPTGRPRYSRTPPMAREKQRT